ncbi:hypothetical protein LEP1GSC192_3594 [Leptospira sp. B5-022]|nr:hypothetical protein LEP1GSC192_3594 [Leptospira sp. B5-022]
MQINNPIFLFPIFCDAKKNTFPSSSSFAYSKPHVFRKKIQAKDGNVSIVCRIHSCF